VSDDRKTAGIGSAERTIVLSRDRPAVIGPIG
jgi:hypothetical protein